MSTKIHNGFEFKCGPTFYEINKKLDSFIPTAKYINRIEASIWLAERATQIFDSYTLDKMDSEIKSSIEVYSPLSIAYKELRDRQRAIEDTKRRDPSVDFTFDVCILPLTKTRTLGIYIAENKELINAWLKQCFIKEYHYQNSTDKPNYISRKDWGKRKRDWDKALINNGFVVNLVGHTGYIPVEFIMERTPKIDKRVKRFAINKIFNDKFAKEQWPGCGGPHSASAYYDYSEWLKNTNDGRCLYNKTAKAIKKKMKRRIGKNDLTKTP